MEKSRYPASDFCIEALWCVHTVERYSVIRKDEMLPFATVWIDLENIVLSEISQTETAKTHVISPICGI